MIVWAGPSRFTGAPIVAIVTGIDLPSMNAKTGPMLQAWVIRQDVAPMAAKRANQDDAVCGDCALRGHNGFDSACYVTVWHGPFNVWKALQRGNYAEPDARTIRSEVRGRDIRVTAYGDPAAVPTAVWENLLTTAKGWVGYTHQWATADPALRWLLMASVETSADAATARALGWRTFRARGRDESVDPGEVICPASDEAGHRVTCQDCQLCRGRSRQARSIAIIAHGKPGNTAAFYRNRRMETIA